MFRHGVSFQVLRSSKQEAKAVGVSCRQSRALSHCHHMLRAATAGLDSYCPACLLPLTLPDPADPRHNQPTHVCDVHGQNQASMTGMLLVACMSSSSSSSNSSSSSSSRNSIWCKSHHRHLRHAQHQRLVKLPLFCQQHCQVLLIQLCSKGREPIVCSNWNISLQKLKMTCWQLERGQT